MIMKKKLINIGSLVKVKDEYATSVYKNKVGIVSEITDHNNKTAKNSKWCLVMFGDDKLYQIDIRLLEGI